MCALGSRLSAVADFSEKVGVYDFKNISVKERMFRKHLVNLFVDAVSETQRLQTKKMILMMFDTEGIKSCRTYRLIADDFQSTITNYELDEMDYKNIIEEVFQERMRMIYDN